MNQQRFPAVFLLSPISCSAEAGRARIPLPLQGETGHKQEGAFSKCEITVKIKHHSSADNSTHKLWEIFSAFTIAKGANVNSPADTGYGMARNPAAPRLLQHSQCSQCCGEERTTPCAPWDSAPTSPAAQSMAPRLGVGIPPMRVSN